MKIIGLTLTLQNLLCVLGVHNVLNVLYVLHVLNMPMDALLACWALFCLFFLQICLFFAIFFPLSVSLTVRILLWNCTNIGTSRDVPDVPRRASVVRGGRSSPQSLWSFEALVDYNSTWDSTEGSHSDKSSLTIYTPLLL